MWLLFGVALAAQKQIKGNCVPRPLFPAGVPCLFDFQCDSQICSPFTKRCSVYRVDVEMERHGSGAKRTAKEVCSPLAKSLACMCKDDGHPDLDQWDIKQCNCSEEFLTKYINGNWVKCHDYEASRLAGILPSAINSRKLIATGPMRRLQGDEDKIVRRSYTQEILFIIDPYSNGQYIIYEDSFVPEVLGRIIVKAMPNTSEQLQISIEKFDMDASQLSWLAAEISRTANIKLTYTITALEQDFETCIELARNEAFEIQIISLAEDPMTYSFSITDVIYEQPEEVEVVVEEKTEDDNIICAAFCPISNLGNGECDWRCYNQDCQWDKGDCGDEDGCAPGCTPDRRGNYYCDMVCYNKNCNWDEGDCGSGIGCQHGCDIVKFLYNNECNWQCFNERCNWDGGDCHADDVTANLNEPCAPDCTGFTGKKCEFCGSGKCCMSDPSVPVEEAIASMTDPEICNPAEGVPEEHVCVRLPKQGCGDGCFPDAVADLICDIVCFNKDCEWDGGDCGDSGCSDGCLPRFLGDGVCDYACYTESCGWDEGDCGEDVGCGDGCLPEWLGNRICDPSCVKENCMWDSGDCGILKQFYQKVSFRFTSLKNVESTYLVNAKGFDDSAIGILQGAILSGIRDILKLNKQIPVLQLKILQSSMKNADGQLMDKADTLDSGQAYNITSNVTDSATADEDEEDDSSERRLTVDYGWYSAASGLAHQKRSMDMNLFFNVDEGTTALQKSIEGRNNTVSIEEWPVVSWWPTLDNNHDDDFDDQIVDLDSEQNNYFNTTGYIYHNKTGRRLSLDYRFGFKYEAKMLESDFDIMWSLVKHKSFKAHLEQIVELSDDLGEFQQFTFNEIKPMKAMLNEDDDLPKKVEGSRIYFEEANCTTTAGSLASQSYEIGACEVETSFDEQMNTVRTYLVIECLEHGMLKETIYQDPKCSSIESTHVVPHNECVADRDSGRYLKFDWVGACMPVKPASLRQLLGIVVEFDPKVTIYPWKDPEPEIDMISFGPTVDPTAEPKADGDDGMDGDAATPTVTDKTDEEVEEIVYSEAPDDNADPDEITDEQKFKIDNTVRLSIEDDVIAKSLPPLDFIEYEVLSFERQPPSDLFPAHHHVYNISIEVTCLNEYFQEVLSYMGSEEFRVRLEDQGRIIDTDEYSLRYVLSWPPVVGPGPLFNSSEIVDDTARVIIEEKNIYTDVVVIIFISLTGVGWCLCIFVSLLFCKHIKKSNLYKMNIESQMNKVITGTGRRGSTVLSRPSGTGTFSEGDLSSLGDRRSGSMLAALQDRRGSSMGSGLCSDAASDNSRRKSSARSDSASMDGSMSQKVKKMRVSGMGQPPNIYRTRRERIIHSISYTFSNFGRIPLIPSFIRRTWRKIRGKEEVDGVVKLGHGKVGEEVRKGITLPKMKGIGLRFSFGSRKTAASETSLSIGESDDDKSNAGSRSTGSRSRSPVPKRR